MNKEAQQTIAMYILVIAVVASLFVLAYVVGMVIINGSGPLLLISITLGFILYWAVMRLFDD